MELNFEIRIDSNTKKEKRIDPNFDCLNIKFENFIFGFEKLLKLKSFDFHMEIVKINRIQRYF